MSTSSFNQLGQLLVPSLAGRIFPDRMTIVAMTATQDDAGGAKTAATNAYTDVPVSYAPKKGSGAMAVGGERQTSIQEYALHFPATHNGARINVDPAIHRFVVAARGNEPAKTFRLTAVPDHSGVIFEATCEKEN